MIRDTETNNTNPLSADNAEGLSLVPSDYADEIKKMDISADQADEFLATLWAVLVQITQMGFHYDVCGQILDQFNQVTEGDGSALDSDHSNYTEMRSDTSGKESKI